MNITVITPAARHSRSGNRVTAVRWARLLRALGHRVRVTDSFTPAAADACIAIHAFRSADAIAACRDRHPALPLVVLLAGTDVYHFQHSDPGPTLAAMAAADRLVGLHERVGEDIPQRFRERLRIIHQSAAPLHHARQPSRRSFDVCVVGHLRAEKDPLLAARAARALAAGSRVRIVHLGKAYDAHWEAEARAEMAANPRYRWRGEVPPAAVRRVFARSHAMVISSRLEGGANVVSEAIVARLPVLASRIPGNVGLLGETHPAYFPPGDAGALTALLERAERDPRFLAAVQYHADARAARFSPQAERDAWRALLAELFPQRPQRSTGRVP
jgi:putative glycosyltransferase (TIGR04348 family)